MKASLCLTFLLLFDFLSLVYAQDNNFKGTYLLTNNKEYMQIDNNSFKIIRTHLCPWCFDLDVSDSLISFGTLENVKNGFLKLTSYSDNNVHKTVTIEESFNSQIMDSVKIKFFFPFKGNYRISASVGYTFKSTETDTIIIPRNKYVLGDLTFEIFNVNLLYNSLNGEYLGRIAFSFPGYPLKNESCNSLIISIPGLTNSYFARYFIDGEYVKIENNKIIWRNREYRKISNFLMVPDVEIGDRAIDVEQGIDWMDKLKK